MKFRLDRIQLEITEECDIRCFGCTRQCRQAPSKERMTLRQVACFVEESRKAKRQWGRIDVMGGEPTLHPELNQILKLLFPLSTGLVRVMTHGRGPQTRQALKALPRHPRLRVGNSNKHSACQPHHSLINKAPIDYGIEPELGCPNLPKCGLTINRYGFYALGGCGAIDRVFGFNLGIRSLREVTPAALTEQLKVLCRLCGHSRTSVYEEGAYEFYSPSWQEALKKWERGEVELPLIYPEESTETAATDRHFAGPGRQG